MIASNLAVTSVWAVLYTALFFDVFSGYRRNVYGYSIFRSTSSFVSVPAYNYRLLGLETLLGLIEMS